MTFLAPLFLIGLLAVPVLALLYLAVQRRRSRYAVAFTNLDLLANLVERRPGWRRHVPTALYLASIAFLVLALARPQMTIAVPREDATIVLTLDVSASMRATDVDPDRLVAAKAAAQQFVDTLPDGVRVGIVAFSDRATVLTTPTADRDVVAAAIDSLTAQGGTAMGDALARSLEISGALRSAAVTPGETPPAAPGATPELQVTPAPGASDDPATGDPAEDPLVAIVLLSDGANTVGEREPLDVAGEAAAAGVPIHTIALGTDEGTVQLRDDTGQLVTVPVPPDEATLQAVADRTGGRFSDAPTSEELSAIYESLGSRVGFVDETQEVTWLFAALGLLTVVGGAGLAAHWFDRFP